MGYSVDSRARARDAVLNCPFKTFAKWRLHASQIAGLDPDAMALATCSADGQPSVRMLLLRGLVAERFRFFTNYKSRKGRELLFNPSAALLFFWAPLHRQVRIDGICEKLSRAESESYFAGRSRASQLTAWASAQSCQMHQADDLERAIGQKSVEFGDQSIPCPEHWGGYGLIPRVFEFWQAGDDRRHRRLQFMRRDDCWVRSELYP